MPMRAAQVMDGRMFAGKRLVAEEWDGVTNYQIEETEAEREHRVKKFEEDLETVSVKVFCNILFLLLWL